MYANEGSAVPIIKVCKCGAKYNPFIKRSDYCACCGVNLEKGEK